MVRTAARRFPAPWRAVPSGGGWVVQDANGVVLVHVYGRDDVDGIYGYHGLTLDEARRIAAGIAKLPLLTEQRKIEAAAELVKQQDEEKRLRRR